PGQPPFPGRAESGTDAPNPGRRDLRVGQRRGVGVPRGSGRSRRGGSIGPARALRLPLRATALSHQEPGPARAVPRTHRERTETAGAAESGGPRGLRPAHPEG
ncbi:MAG: hypothetical protein ACK559_21420, partial [bacterium]